MTVTVLAAPQGEPDDLTRIRGIGQVLARELNAAGIYHFWQIAALTESDLPTLGFRGKIDWPDKIEQAERLRPPNASELAQGRAALGDDPDKPQTPSGEAAARAATNAPQPKAPSAGSGDPVAPRDGAGARTVDVAISALATLPPEARERGELVVKTGSADRRRRAGHAFGRQETVIPLRELTDTDLAAIEADRELISVVRLPAG